MSTNYFFKSIKIDNYRGLDKLTIDSLRRINLLGGFNGTGKSTFLEAIFMMLDRRNPTVLMRTFASKNLQVPYPDGLDYIFGKQGKDVPVKICTATSSGSLDLLLSRGSAPTTMNVATQSNQTLGSHLSPSTADSRQVGIYLRTIFNGNDDDAAFAMQLNHEQFNFSITRTGQSPNIPGVIMTPSARPLPIEDAQRYSMLVKERRTNTVVENLKFLNPELKSFQLLQEGNQPTLYAEMNDGTLLQTNLLGGGFQSVLSIVLLMMTNRNGIVLFDEVDAAIHFTRLDFFWKLVATLANNENCQVFAVTHSRECIASALAGITDCGRLQDLQYIRLENDDVDTDAIVYSGEELSDAVKAGWEIR